MTKRKISAQIIADSVNKQGNRITTFVLVFPRIVLAEFNTHRMLSRNSASSRAIPFEKMLKMVEEDPFIPIKWLKDHSGMQGFEELDSRNAEVCLSGWLQAKNFAVSQAKHLSERGLTKQFVNRLLEPFLWHTVICTGTEWENFFALRAHSAAEIHIQDLAHKMLGEYNKSLPKILNEGDWHIPFGYKIDTDKLGDILDNGSRIYTKAIQTEGLLKIATARCARVSYMNFEGKDDYSADIQLHDRLLASGHMSPFEHCAQAMNKIDFDDEFGSGGWSGNFRGFIQYRKLISGENKIDERVHKIKNVSF